MRKKAFVTILTTVGLVLILVSTVNLFLVVVNRANHVYLTIASSSMEPVISKGDVVKVKLEVNSSEIHAAPKDDDPPGDIIVFYSPSDPKPVLIVHRAVSKHIVFGNCYFTTQGDGNPDPDQWIVRERDIVGEVVEVNSAIWTYSYDFWVVILAIGIIIMLGGVVASVLLRGKKGEG